MTDKWIYFRTWYTMDFVTPDIRADLVQHIKSLAKFFADVKKKKMIGILLSLTSYYIMMLIKLIRLLGSWDMKNSFH